MNGITSPQQFPEASSAAEAAASSSASRTAKAAPAAVSLVPSGTVGGSAPTDEARVSAAAEMIAQASSASDVRAEKVAALQQTIAAGTYSVSSSDVADKMIAFLQQ